MKLFIIRHLRTNYNEKGVLQGRMDIPILPPSPETLQQIELNRMALGDIETFDHILVSRLQRTRMTAELYVDKSCSVEPLLDELDFGDYEGRQKSELLEEQEQWISDPAALTLGEPLTALAGRVEDFFEKYKQADRVLAFGHGAWIRACVASVESGTIEQMNRMDIANNQVIVIDRPVSGEGM